MGQGKAMLGMPTALTLYALLAGCVWVLAGTSLVRQGHISRVTVLRFTMWTAAIAGCALTVLRRLEMGPMANTVLMAGSLLLIFSFVVTALAGKEGAGGSKGLMFIVTALTMVEVLFLLVHPAGMSENFALVIALVFLPGFVLQVRNSGASRESLLSLVFRVSTAVVTASVALGLLLPSLAYGAAFSDLRRFDIPGLPGRLSGLTPHPNFLSITALICIVLALSEKPRGRRFALAASVAALVMAESRVALLTLILAAVVVRICRGQNQMLRPSFALPLGIALVLQSGALEDTTLGGDLTTNGRYRVWDVVFASFTNHPLNGWGPLAFTEESGSPLLVAGLQHAHNQVIQGIAEGGLLGGLLSLALLLALIRIGVQNRRQPLYPAVATIIIMNVLTEPFFTLHLYGLNYAIVPAFLMLIIMMSAPAREPKTEHSPNEQRRKSLALAAK